MIKNKKILVVGAGGFIAGHLMKRLLENGNSITATDIKPKEFWFQDFDFILSISFCRFYLVFKLKFSTIPI